MQMAIENESGGKNNLQSLVLRGKLQYIEFRSIIVLRDTILSEFWP